MSLKLKENESQENTGGKRMEPIVHAPKESLPGRSKTIIWVVVVIVLIVGIGILYKFGIISNKKPSNNEQVFTGSADTVKAAAGGPSIGQQQSETVGGAVGEKSTVKNEQNKQTRQGTKQIASHQVSPEHNTGTQPAAGQFTIYIGTYTSKTVAGEESDRWNEAGYQSFVSEHSGKKGSEYRVCLGRYADKNDARKQAEKLKDAFEGGYWVDVVK